MKNLCIIYDEYFLDHKADFYHAESPERLIAIIDYLQKNNLTADIRFIPPEEATEKQITAVHSKEHYDFVRESIENKKKMLDPDTYINESSWKAALLAAGSVVNAVDLAERKEFKNIFCLVRPPGHHAERSRAMGFCLFNNIAVGAAHAINAHGKKRIAIVDWDVHHGNGTQNIFYDSNEVLFISIHQHPLYPGTGSEIETGSGKGEGYTINYPLPPGTGGNVYTKLMKQEITKTLEKYSPEMLFISAGFDAHKEDPLANMNLSSADFGKMTSVLKEFADGINIPVISVLEGGYNLNALSESAAEHIKILNA